MIAALLLAASFARAADRATEPPRVDLPAMPVAAPVGQAALPGAGLVNVLAAPEVALPAAVAPAAAAAAGPASADIPALPASAAASPADAAGGTVPTAAPAAQAAAAGTGLAARVGRVLSRIVNPFGGDKKPEEASPQVAARRAAYAKAMSGDHWGAIKPELTRDLTLLRALKTKQDKQEFLRQVGAQVVARLLERHGAKELGFHFNLHGGQPEGYVDGNGIRATMGDIALNYTMNGDRNDKVYFFRSSQVNLYDALDERDPAQLVFPSRMGNVFMAFRLDSEALERGRRDGAVLKDAAIFMDFDTAKMRGVPYSAFAVPPARVFDVPKSLGLGRLSRDEVTLAAMRYIEQLGTSADTPLAR